MRRAWGQTHQHSMPSNVVITYQVTQECTSLVGAPGGFPAGYPCAASSLAARLPVLGSAQVQRANPQPPARSKDSVCMMLQLHAGPVKGRADNPAKKKAKRQPEQHGHADLLPSTRTLEGCASRVAHIENPDAAGAGYMLESWA